MKPSQEVNAKENADASSSLSHFFKDWALNSKTHGLSNIVRTRNLIIRSIYLVCFMICSCYCFIECASLVISYNQFSVITSYSTVNEAPAKFPAVVRFFLEVIKIKILTSVLAGLIDF